jgi:membrane protein YdbS with pleckstrin-like domain
MSIHRNIRDSERRKKRLIVPAFYFLVEMTLMWLILSLIQLKFNLFTWDTWAIFVFVLVVLYGIAKTIHIYKRQKDYPIPDNVE